MSDSIPVEQFTLPISAATGNILLTVVLIALGSFAIYAIFLNIDPDKRETTWKELQNVGGFIALIIWLPLFLGALWVCAHILYDAFASPASVLSAQTNGRTISAFFAALAALIAAPLLIWRSYNVHRQTNTAEQGQITDRITKAVEQIGTVETVKRDEKDQTVPNLEVRIGGLHALERIANNSPDDRESIISILCHYVRHNLIDHKASVDLKGETGELRLREDIALALRVISRLSTSERNSNSSFLAPLQNCNFAYYEMESINFSFMDLSYSYLYQTKQVHISYFGCKLNICSFSDSVLRRVQFMGSRLTRAFFEHTFFFASSFANASQSKCHFEGSGFFLTLLDEANFDVTRLESAFIGKKSSFPTPPSLTLIQPRPNGWLIGDEDPFFDDFEEFKTAWHQWRADNGFPKL